MEVEHGSFSWDNEKTRVLTKLVTCTNIYISETIVSRVTQPISVFAMDFEINTPCRMDQMDVEHFHTVDFKL